MKKISFIVYYPYQWFIYKNIYNKIPAEKREVIIDLSASPELQDERVRADIVSLLQREGAPFRILGGFDGLNEKGFRDFFADVEVIVSCWENGCVSNDAVRHIKKVNTTYGIAKELTLLRPTRSIYDVILAYGKRDQRYFELLTKSIAIGNPRLDNFYAGVTDAAVREKLLAHFDDRKKKTVLYVPTHGDLGSFREMLPAFEQLSRHYNIIFKPHYLTLREEKAIVERYRQIRSLLVIDDSWDTIEVMALSDIIVSDNSSAIFDAMQVDRPLVVCDFLGNQFLDIVHKKLRLVKRGVAGALTYSGSLEQEVKDRRLIATIKKPDNLNNVLAHIEEIDSQYRHFRKELVRDNFEYTDGHSSERAAEIIMRIYATEREYVPGILYHAYLAYNNRFYQGMIDSRDKEIVLTSLSNTVVVWIYCESYPNRDEVLVTLYSALRERGVASVCVSGTVGKDVTDSITQGEFSDRVSFFEQHADGLRFISSQLGKFDSLLFVKAKTMVKDLNTIFNFQVACKRDMLFFAENIVFNPKDATPVLFYLLKHEILGPQGLSESVLTSVSYDQIHSIEKCAAFMDTRTLLGHFISPSAAASFDNMISTFIQIDSLKGKSYDYLGVSHIDYALMPNFLREGYPSKSSDVYARLGARGLMLHALGMPVKRWPDKKIGKYLFEVLTGNFSYYWLLRLFFYKRASVAKYVFLRGAYSFLKKTLANLNGS